MPIQIQYLVDMVSMQGEVHSYDTINKTFNRKIEAYIEFIIHHIAEIWSRVPKWTPLYSPWWSSSQPDFIPALPQSVAVQTWESRATNEALAAGDTPCFPIMEAKTPCASTRLFITALPFSGIEESSEKAICHCPHDFSEITQSMENEKKFT